MGKKIKKFKTLFHTKDPYERIRILLEIRLNNLIFGSHPSCAISYDEFLRNFKSTASINLLPIKKEADESFLKSICKFDEIADKKANLPFPAYYNADNSLSSICYALTRYLKPKIVIESGVGYGILSTVILQAMERNGIGTLISIDLPPILDHSGVYTGLIVPQHLKERWKLYLGSSRQQIPKIMKNTFDIGLFISDSANVYTIQRREFEDVWGSLSSNGVMVFNNISRKFQKYLTSLDKAKLYSVWQIEKPLCVTGILLKK